MCLGSRAGYEDMEDCISTVARRARSFTAPAPMSALAAGHESVGVRAVRWQPKGPLVVAVHAIETAA